MTAPDSGIAQAVPMGPIPDRKPSTGVPLHGWLDRGTARLLCSAGNQHTKVIIELGSWLGRSALLLAGAYPRATIYCIDIWRGYADAMPEKEAPLLYDAFLEHTWPHRGRIIPIRSDTVEGMRGLARSGVKADVVYIDADHSTEGCLRDLRTAFELFGGAKLVGDDWRWPTVRKAVRSFARQNGLIIEVDGNGWRLRQKAPLALRALWAYRRLRGARHKRSMKTIRVPKVGA
jgi:hypothetical protein